MPLSLRGTSRWLKKAGYGYFGELIHHYMWLMFCGKVYFGARSYQPKEHGMHRHVRPIDLYFDCVTPVRFAGKLFKCDIMLSKLFCVMSL